MSKFFLPVFLVLVLAFFQIMPEVALAQTNSTSVGATIKLSVCGDGVVEGLEDCEGADLSGQTCQSLYYGPGVLSCDISCDFNTIECAEPSPTPIPTSVSVVAQSSSQSTTSVFNSGNSPAETNSNNITFLDRNSFFVINNNILNYDYDGDGLILKKDLRLVVGSWVENSFKNENPQLDRCDFDDSRECNMIDFSILMYYVDRRLS